MGDFYILFSSQKNIGEYLLILNKIRYKQMQFFRTVEKKDLGTYALSTT